MLLLNPYVDEDDKAIPYIENRSLDGFLKYYKDGNCLDNCTKCKYCGKIAKKSIRIDKEASEKHLSELDNFNNGLISSKFVPRKPTQKTT